MPLHKISNVELRENCKEYIETFEFWLRRFINDVLVKEFGNKYWDQLDESGNHLIKNEIKEKVSLRIEKNPAKFPRWIDATLLEHLQNILCKEFLFKKYFKKALIFDTIVNFEQVRTYISKIIQVRNLLYHANHISVRQAEQAICYSNDIIESIKEFYKSENKTMEFNAPLIIKYSDSSGNIFFREQFNKSGFGSDLVLRDTKFRCGDRFRAEIEIDATFSKDEYIIEWYSKKKMIEFQNKTTIEYKFDENDVGELFGIGARVISNKKWHRCNSYDDELYIIFSVLPPIE